MEQIKNLMDKKTYSKDLGELSKKELQKTITDLFQLQKNAKEQDLKIKFSLAKINTHYILVGKLLI